VVLTFAQPEPFIYIVAHALKLLGGAAGGRVAEKQFLRAYNLRQSPVDKAM